MALRLPPFKITVYRLLKGPSEPACTLPLATTSPVDAFIHLTGLRPGLPENYGASLTDSEDMTVRPQDTAWSDEESTP